MGGEQASPPRPLGRPFDGLRASGLPTSRSIGYSGIEEAFGGLLELGAEVGMGDVDQLLGPLPD